MAKKTTNKLQDNVLEETSNSSSLRGFAQHGPPENVTFVNVLALDSRLNHTTVPSQFRSHSLVRGRYFYSIPRQLLERVFEGEVGENLEFDQNLYELELSMSAVSGDHSFQIGHWNGQPVLFALMDKPPWRQRDLMETGLSKAKAASTAKLMNERLSTFSEISGAYCGWLMTNRVFLEEMNGLLRDFGDRMLRWGTSMVGLPISKSMLPGQFNPTGEEGWQEYDTAVLEFCVRWRLQGLAGPRIPVPMKPMISGQFPITIVNQLMRAGGVFNWPDTFPLFAKDVLRDLIADALQPSSDTQHLEGWHKIIDVRNKAKNQFPSLERRFRLQHFWRLLRQRHPGIFNRRAARIERAFAAFFGVTESSMHADRMTIQKALGKDWDLRAELA